MANWHHQEWLKARECLPNSPDRANGHSEDNFKKRHAALTKHLTAESIPSTLLALIDGRPIGSASVIFYQFSRNKFKSPWLTNVFVEQTHRKRGIGSQLITEACDLAKQAGVTRLQLYTHDKADFYINLDWQVLRTGQVQRRPVAILEKRL